MLKIVGISMGKRRIGKRSAIDLDTLLGILKNVGIATIVLLFIYLVVSGKLKGAWEGLINSIRYRT